MNSFTQASRLLDALGKGPPSRKQLPLEARSCNPLPLESPRLDHTSNSRAFV